MERIGSDGATNIELAFGEDGESVIQIAPLPRWELLLTFNHSVDDADLLMPRKHLQQKNSDDDRRRSS